MQPITHALRQLGKLVTGLVGLLTAQVGNQGQGCAARGLPAATCGVPLHVGPGKRRPWIEDTARHSFEPGTGGKLTLTAAVGDVEVKAVNSNAVTIEIVRRVYADEQEAAARLLEKLLVEVAQQDQDVTVRVRLRRDTADDERRRISLHVQIFVPRHYNLDVSTVGCFRADDLQGEVKVATAGGDISLGHIQGAVIAASAGGRIDLARVDGEVVVNSAGGKLRAGQLTGSVKLDTAGGSVSIEDAGGALEVATDGGSFTAHLSRQPPAASNINTAGGRLVLSLAQRVGVELDAAATHGRVRFDDAESAGPKSKRNVLQTSINGGGPQLILRSADGSIYLTRRPPAGHK